MLLSLKENETNLTLNKLNLSWGTMKWRFCFFRQIEQLKQTKDSSLADGNFQFENIITEELYSLFFVLGFLI